MPTQPRGNFASSTNRPHDASSILWTNASQCRRTRVAQVRRCQAPWAPFNAFWAGFDGIACFCAWREILARLCPTAGRFCVGSVFLAEFFVGQFAQDVFSTLARYSASGSKPSILALAMACSQFFRRTASVVGFAVFWLVFSGESRSFRGFPEPQK